MVSKETITGATTLVASVIAVIASVIAVVASVIAHDWDDTLGEPLMPEVGVEPTRPEGHGILSAARLPFRHSGRGQR
jgi:hypothetical protein